MQCHDREANRRPRVRRPTTRPASHPHVHEETKCNFPVRQCSKCCGLRIAVSPPRHTSPSTRATSTTCTDRLAAGTNAIFHLAAGGRTPSIILPVEFFISQIPYSTPSAPHDPRSIQQQQQQLSRTTTTGFLSNDTDFSLSLGSSTDDASPIHPRPTHLLPVSKIYRHTYSNQASASRRQRYDEVLRTNF